MIAADPRVNPSHPLSRGMVFGLRLDQGQILDLESHGAVRNRVTQTRSGIWQSEARGLRFPDASTANNPLFRLPLSGTLTEGTIAIWFTPLTTTSFETICGPDVSTSSVFVARASTTTTWRLGWKNTTSTGPTVANGETAIIASRWDSVSGLIETFKDGSPDASYTGGTGSLSLGTFGIGCRGASTTGPTAGGTIIRGMWLWDRKLSNAELRAHRERPFGYLEQPRRRVSVFIPAAGPNYLDGAAGASGGATTGATGGLVLRGAASVSAGSATVGLALLVLASAGTSAGTAITTGTGEIVAGGGVITSTASSAGSASTSAASSLLMRGGAAASGVASTGGSGRLFLASSASVSGASNTTATGEIVTVGGVLLSTASSAGGSATSATSTMTTAGPAVSSAVCVTSATGRLILAAQATANGSCVTVAGSSLVSPTTAPIYTTAQRLRLAGFRASLAVRGMTLSLNGTAKSCKFLINPQGQPSGQWDLSKEEGATDELHVLREHLGSQRVKVGDVWTDPIRSTTYRVVAIEDTPVNIAVVLKATTAALEEA